LQFHFRRHRLTAAGPRLGTNDLAVPQAFDPGHRAVGAASAIRDEGRSYHYLPPARYAEADPSLGNEAEQALAATGFSVERGSTWTTDAPFCEGPTTIASRRDEGVLAVEMEAAALYAFAQARLKAVLSFAHVTNQMGRADLDFEEGEAVGARDALRLIERSSIQSTGNSSVPHDG
jgi:uridine phosphorylase